jgi:hypothetical protein
MVYDIQAMARALLIALLGVACGGSRAPVGAWIAAHGVKQKLAAKPCYQPCACEGAMCEDRRKSESNAAVPGLGKVLGKAGGRRGVHRWSGTRFVRDESPPAPPSAPIGDLGADTCPPCPSY